mmetsp:Transcript_42611/g.138197  ORF Transcript_42611/g.138197 Transcript_42611/m.138197 type:complete len:222 (-) Transcript_42611:978-1643(-)
MFYATHRLPQLPPSPPATPQVKQASLSRGVISSERQSSLSARREAEGRTRHILHERAHRLCINSGLRLHSSALAHIGHRWSLSSHPRPDDCTAAAVPPPVRPDASACSRRRAAWAAAPPFSLVSFPRGSAATASSFGAADALVAPDRSCTGCCTEDLAGEHTPQVRLQRLCMKKGLRVHSPAASHTAQLSAEATSTHAPLKDRAASAGSGSSYVSGSSSSS